MGAIGMDWNASYAKATEERPNERYLDFQLKKQVFDMDLSDGRQLLATPGTGSTLTLSDKFSLKELTEQQEDIKEEDMKFSANFKASLNNGAKLKFGAKVVRKTKEKEIDFYEYTPKDEDAFMTNSLKNTVDQSTDKFMPSDKYQVGTFASKEYVGGLNLNDAPQFDKEQVQAELAENFEARETVSSGYVRFDHKFASDINLMAGLRMEHTSLRYTGRNYDDETASISCLTFPPSAIARVCIPLQMPSIGICLLYASCTVSSSGRSRCEFMPCSSGTGSSPHHRGLKSPPPDSNSPSMLSRVLMIASVSFTGGIITGTPPALTTAM